MITNAINLVTKQKVPKRCIYENRVGREHYLTVFWEKQKKRDLQFPESPVVYGAHGRSRTSDRLVRSQVLYPAELHARYLVNFNP